jgi:hypothetical protein
MSKSKIIEYDEHKFKSPLELYFYFYVKELEEYGFLTNISYETSTFELTKPYSRDYLQQGKKKLMTKSEHIFQKSSITSDFTFDFLPKAEGIFYIGNNPINCLAKEIPFRLADEDGIDLQCLVEVKSIQMRSSTSSNVSWPYKAKFCLREHNKLIYKIQPYSPQGRNCLFEKTFTPKNVLKLEVYKKNCKFGGKGDSKIKYQTRTLGEFLNLKNIKL